MIHKKQCERSRASRKKRCKMPGKVKEKSVNSRMKREEQKKIIIYIFTLKIYYFSSVFLAFHHFTAVPGLLSFFSFAYKEP